MPRPLHITGIDIGTHSVKVVIVQAERDNPRALPHIIGRGEALSRGLRHGYIVNGADIVRSIKSALHSAEKMAGMRVRQVYLSLGGVSLEGATAHGSAVVSRADGEVTELDTEKALAASEQAIPKIVSINRKIVHAIPGEYRLDGKTVLGQPVGMKGTRLETRTLFITALEQHLNDLIQAVEDAGVMVIDVMAAPLAASLVSLTRAQKIAGCVLANIGAETVSIVVFDDNMPISLQVFPIGSTDITNDIALGFQIPLEEAEELKMGKTTSGVPHSKKKVEEIIAARANDILELIEAHLKKTGKSGLLPAGIVLEGGGAGITTIEDLAKAALKLPARTTVAQPFQTTRGELRDPSWSTAYGLCVWGAHASDDEEPMGIRIAKHAKNKILDWIRQFLP